MAGSTTSRFARPQAPERVLQVASELFYGEGIHAIGVERIAAESDTSKATLYAHYGSKDGLIAAYIERYTDDARERMELELRQAGDDPRDGLLALFDGLVDWHAEEGFRGCAYINAAAELPDADHPAAKIGQRHRAWVRDLFGALAAACGAPDSAAAGAQLLMLYDGATVAAGLDGTPRAAALAREIVQGLIDRWAREGLSS